MFNGSPSTPLILFYCAPDYARRGNIRFFSVDSSHSVGHGPNQIASVSRDAAFRALSGVRWRDIRGEPPVQPKSGGNNPRIKDEHPRFIQQTYPTCRVPQLRSRRWIHLLAQCRRRSRPMRMALSIRATQTESISWSEPTALCMDGLRLVDCRSVSCT